MGLRGYGRVLLSRLRLAVVFGVVALAAPVSAATASSSGFVPHRANGTPARDPIFVEPGDHGATVLHAIERARHTIDIVIYQLGGPNVVGQRGAPGALMKAVTRGVDVRIIVNGQFFNAACTATTPQKKCLRSPDFAPIRATIASLRFAERRAGRRAGSVSVGFANNNFQITHQKTVLIDAADPRTGRPVAAGRLPQSARALVMTLNLQAGFPNAWGSVSATDPRAGCSAPCDEFAGTRDFGLVVEQRPLISHIENVFYSDLNCGSVPPGTKRSRSNTNHLLATPGPETWSNGATRLRTDGRQIYPFSLYPYDALPATWTLQGNARLRELALIRGAKRSLVAYNEEMSDPQIIHALSAAARRLGPGKVRVVMTENSDWASAFDTLTQAGAQIEVFPAASNVLYIHAKAIVADGRRAFMGSENFSQASLDDNRELGLMLSSAAHPGREYLSDPRAIATIARTFNSDFTNPASYRWTVSPQPLGRGALGSPAGAGGDPASGNYPLRCGPVFTYKPGRR
jgi:phosphatidylserine/phosphatidylglycerophosphate/cardiolipin synthase-like enzyme